MLQSSTNLSKKINRVNTKNLICFNISDFSFLGVPNDIPFAEFRSFQNSNYLFVEDLKNYIGAQVNYLRCLLFSFIFFSQAINMKYIKNNRK